MDSAYQLPEVRLANSVATTITVFYAFHSSDAMRLDNVLV